MIYYFSYNTNHASTLFDTTPAYVVDGDLDTSAKSAVGGDDSHIVTAHDYDGTDYGTILSVSIGIYAWNIYYSYGNLNVIPLFSGTTAGDTYTQGYIMYTTPTWIDITHDTNAPAVWTIADLQNLDVRIDWDWTSFSGAYVRLYHIKLKVETTDTWITGEVNDKTLYMANCEGADGSTTLVDSSYYEDNMSLRNGAAIDDDVTYSAAFGNTLLLDGANDWAYTTYNPSLIDNWNFFDWTSTSATFDLFVKHDDHAGTETYFNLPMGADTTHYICMWHIHGTGIQWVVHDDPDDIVILQGGEIADTDWHHVAFIKVGSEYGIYKDGVQVAYVSDASTLTLDAGMLAIGAQVNGILQQNFFDGNMDHIHIYHGNKYNAAPNVGLTNTITIPTKPFKRVILQKQTTGLT